MTRVNPPVTASDPEEAVQQWFALMGHYCASVDYDAAERIFAEDVVSFGTAMDIVRGRKALREGQWESIWGNITSFKMDPDNVNASGSGNQAWGVVTWTSTGYDSDHKPFHRPGRATVTLETSGRSLAGRAYALFTVPRHTTAHLRHGEVVSVQST